MGASAAVPTSLNELFRVLVDQQTDPVCLYERTGTIRYANHAYAQLFDMTPSEIVGVYISDLAPEPSWDEAEANLLKNAALRLGQSRVDEFELVDREGNPVWFEWRDEPVEVPGTNEQLILAVGRNTTKRHVDAQAMRDLNRRLETSNRDLADFASVASHDLREPLRKISSFGSRLQQSAAEELSPRNIDYVERMVSAADRMQGLIDGLLKLSRISTEANEFTAVELDAVAADALCDLEFAIADASATVRVGPMPVVTGDASQLTELFQNLIANAVKFRRPDVDPIVSIDATVTDRETVVVSVADNGIGFEQAQAETIFVTFARLHGRSQFEGSGIGLSVCKRIVERHGGAISASSEPGRGTTFTVELPLASGS